MLKVGDKLDGRYRIEEKVGEGGMGVVYRARDMELGKTIALKILSRILQDDEVAIQNLRREVGLTQDLNHSNIVNIYHIERRAEIPFITMEYVDGTMLSKVLAREGTLDIQTFASFSIQITRGLEHAHNKNIIHRDLKPANIMIDQDGIVKIMDFGIASIAKESQTRLTDHQISGTLSYMAPEYLMGGMPDSRTDIYGLGCMFYELLTGKPPFWRGDITHQHLHREAEAINGIDIRLNDIIHKCIEKDPENRYQTVTELKATLKNLYSRMPMSDSRISLPDDATIEVKDVLGHIAADDVIRESKDWSLKIASISRIFLFALVVIVILSSLVLLISWPAESQPILSEAAGKSQLPEEDESQVAEQKLIESKVSPAIVLISSISNFKVLTMWRAYISEQPLKALIPPAETPKERDNRTIYQKFADRSGMRRASGPRQEVNPTNIQPIKVKFTTCQISKTKSGGAPWDRVGKIPDLVVVLVANGKAISWRRLIPGSMVNMAELVSFKNTGLALTGPRGSELSIRLLDIDEEREEELDVFLLGRLMRSKNMRLQGEHSTLEVEIEVRRLGDRDGSIS